MTNTANVIPRLDALETKMVQIMAAYGDDEDAGADGGLYDVQLANSNEPFIPVGQKRRAANKLRQSLIRSGRRGTLTRPTFDLQTLAKFKESELLKQLYDRANDPHYIPTNKAATSKMPRKQHNILPTLGQQKADKDESIDGSVDNSNGWQGGGGNGGPTINISKDQVGQFMQLVQNGNRPPPVLHLHKRYATAVKHVKMGFGTATPIDGLTVSSSWRQADDGLRSLRAILITKTIQHPDDFLKVSLHTKIWPSFFQWTILAHEKRIPSIISSLSLSPLFP